VWLIPWKEGAALGEVNRWRMASAVAAIRGSSADNRLSGTQPTSEPMAPE
jgi:hypothetical protein